MTTASSYNTAWFVFVIAAPGHADSASFDLFAVNAFAKMLCVAQKETIDFDIAALGLKLLYLR